MVPFCLCDPGVEISLNISSSTRKWSLHWEAFSRIPCNEVSPIQTSRKSNGTVEKQFAKTKLDHPREEHDLNDETSPPFGK